MVMVQSEGWCRPPTVAHTERQDQEAVRRFVKPAVARSLRFLRRANLTLFIAFAHRRTALTVIDRWGWYRLQMGTSTASPHMVARALYAPREATEVVARSSRFPRRVI